MSQPEAPRCRLEEERLMGQLEPAADLLARVRKQQ